jgi:hypothetical protein
MELAPPTRTPLISGPVPKRAKGLTYTSLGRSPRSTPPQTKRANGPTYIPMGPSAPSTAPESGICFHLTCLNGRLYTYTRKQTQLLFTLTAIMHSTYNEKHEKMGGVLAHLTRLNGALYSQKALPTWGILSPLTTMMRTTYGKKSTWGGGEGGYPTYPPIACSRSARISCTSSIPTEMRISPSVIPSFARPSAPTAACVMVAG